MPATPPLFTAPTASRTYANKKLGIMNALAAAKGYLTLPLGTPFKLVTPTNTTPKLTMKQWIEPEEWPENPTEIGHW